jgi:hypothetical protein
MIRMLVVEDDPLVSATMEAELERLIEETMQLRERNSRVRYRPLASASPDGTSESK